MRTMPRFAAAGFIATFAAMGWTDSAAAQPVAAQVGQAEVMQSDRPVLVDFSAAWCGPCKKLEPIVDEIAGDYDGRLKVVKVDVDSNPSTAARFGVMSVPTLLLVSGTVSTSTGSSDSALIMTMELDSPVRFSSRDQGVSDVVGDAKMRRAASDRFAAHFHSLLGVARLQIDFRKQSAGPIMRWT